MFLEALTCEKSPFRNHFGEPLWLAELHFLSLQPFDVPLTVLPPSGWSVSCMGFFFPPFVASRPPWWPEGSGSSGLRWKIVAQVLFLKCWILETVNVDAAVPHLHFTLVCFHFCRDPKWDCWSLKFCLCCSVLTCCFPTVVASCLNVHGEGNCFFLLLHTEDCLLTDLFLDKCL